MKKEDISILLAEDNTTTQTLLKEFMETILGYSKVVCVNDGFEALEQLAENSFDIIITDHDMPRMNGQELIKELQLTHPQIPIILMTVYDKDNPEIKDLQGVEYFQKPITNFDLIEEKIQQLCP